MDIKELRIGNVLNYSWRGLCFIDGILSEKEIFVTMQNSNIKLKLKIEDLKPIPITQKWLLISGFNVIKDNKYFHKDFNRLYFDISNQLIKHIGNINGIIKEIESVHRLQNFFYEQVDQELNINISDEIKRIDTKKN